MKAAAQSFIAAALASALLAILLLSPRDKLLSNFGIGDLADAASLVAPFVAFGLAVFCAPLTALLKKQKATQGQAAALLITVGAFGGWLMLLPLLGPNFAMFGTAFGAASAACWSYFHRKSFGRPTEMSETADA